MKYLEERLFGDKPVEKRLYPLKGTINWMRFLAMQVDEKGFSSAELHARYSPVDRSESGDLVQR